MSWPLLPLPPTQFQSSQCVGLVHIYCITLQRQSSPNKPMSTISSIVCQNWVHMLGWWSFSRCYCVILSVNWHLRHFLFFFSFFLTIFLDTLIPKATEIFMYVSLCTVLRALPYSPGRRHRVECQRFEVVTVFLPLHLCMAAAGIVCLLCMHVTPVCLTAVTVSLLVMHFLILLDDYCLYFYFEDDEVILAN